MYELLLYKLERSTGRMTLWMKCNVLFYVVLVLLNILVLLYIFSAKNQNPDTHRLSSRLKKTVILQEHPVPARVPPVVYFKPDEESADYISYENGASIDGRLSGVEQRLNFSKNGGKTSPDILGIKRHIFLPEKETFVHVHMQKTGGSQFSRLLLSLDVPFPCRHLSGRLFEPNFKVFGPGSFRCRGKSAGKRLEDDFLLSRYSIGWPCGVHASFHRLVQCVPQKLKRRKLLYISNLRHPVERVVSEYFHGIEGWADNLHGDTKHWPLPVDFFCNGTKRDGFPGGCNGMQAGFGLFPLNQEEMSRNRAEPERSSGMQGRRISLFDYLLCPATYKNNRQTKMLALNQSCVPVNGSLNREELVRSAIGALIALDFFGIAERMRESQLLFEFTFGVRFKVKASASKKTPYRQYLHPAQVRMIEQLEDMDMAVYNAAKHIFQRRLAECGSYCSIRPATEAAT